MASTPIDNEEGSIEKLRDMLLKLTETHAHEIEEKDEMKAMIKTYFTESDTLPVHKLV